ncbi:hypothetical protein EC9_14060 [Rosistilla ulvae]|uniref:Class I SAM-dependent methyltransferase n=1 Tax=Rosistilla ulvae TaxID=1930277 RepID=A0A517LX77_9BACT|nr:class I SAM-dependent methyltransferase [Rosistilla ulvae]QDS87228.1 hypothetical protein EC9_14060 [Rosistilla ulvae]
MLPEMLRKLKNRVTHRPDTNAIAAYRDHCTTHSTDANEWASQIDADIWKESLEFAQSQRSLADRVLQQIPVKLGGGGFYALLYFITRIARPTTIVETGVAAGFSSRAFLKSIEVNDHGRLISSDFPYIRFDNPERYIGVLVEPEIRCNWTLLIGCDRRNLPLIAEEAGEIDLLHYDSDKTVEGRNFALQSLEKNITSSTIVVFDDIQDNLHFRDYVAASNREHLIFEFLGKYIGFVPPLHSTKWNRK